MHVCRLQAVTPWCYAGCGNNVFHDFMDALAACVNHHELELASYLSHLPCLLQSPVHLKLLIGLQAEHSSLWQQVASRPTDQLECPPEDYSRPDSLQQSDDGR